LPLDKAERAGFQASIDSIRTDIKQL
jgi:hypothetical protein